MNTVIKGTKTIEEYKRLKEFMQQQALEHFKKHKEAFEEWKEGDIKKVWFDKDNNICIEYDSGNYWHYNDNGEWW